ncbi:TonB-dependent receptor plug domain-containing protein [Sphingobium boeckii]|uniref:Outer membrane receptor protein involved in Fe transport n=1 Tax=Sphingobium boeckii TaxID=1082345 RepID=A0A7W9EHD7_9SPHN|nr:TonB-dependent receptor [Sphingobium boeckii]MBB5687666.1 outer membrane receptor protein involved in Fe transport [Sphingobium boeckii]
MSHPTSKAMFCSGVSLVAALALASPSFAQNSSQAEDEAIASSPDEIVVTGSRIARPELDVANPIVTVTAQAIENTGQINITDVLTRNPALTASVGGSLSGGADAGFGETGANLLDLRNLGTNRTLVLVNGRRHVAGVPDSAAVDINSIPQDLIERVDVLTGGASAVYGADGVSGVVNFVLKQKFEGLIARGQAGISSRGDAGQRFGSIVAGTNFADDRGNVTLAYEYSKNDRLSSFDRSFSGDPAKNFALYRDLDDFPDDPAVIDRILYNNLTWADSAPDGAVDLDLDGIPDFTGSGLAYDRGLSIPSSGGRAVGGSNTPTAGYFGDLLPSNERHAGNLLASFEVSPALRLFGEAKFVRTDAFSVGQPSFDFFTFLAPDNAYLNDRFGIGAAPDGALISRDNFDFGIRGETIRRETARFVVGADGDISDNARYELSYVYGQTKSRSTQTSNLIADRYFAALDAVVDPGTGNIVCRSTLDPASNIDPNNFDAPATTFTPGTGSICRPLNVLGSGVASPEALAFVLADNMTRSIIKQHVVSGSVTGDFDALFKLPGGSLGFAVGAEYRKESSLQTPDIAIQNGEFRDFAAIPISGGKFDVKEAFAELNAPILADMPFAHLLSVSAAIRFSDYSTVGNTTTWKFDGIYAPVPDVRFRGSYSQAVRAPNIGELFLPATGTFGFVTDPCDVQRLGEGTQYRAANCAAILSGLGLTPAQIAGFSPSTDSEATTSRRGTVGGNSGLREETAKTWTAGVVIQPSFIPRLSITFDWYDIRIKGAVNTPTPTELADLCVDQPSVDNIYCANVFREAGTGFVLGDGSDPQRRIGFNVRPENVAAFKTAGADFSIRYRLPEFGYGNFQLNLVGGYLDKIEFVPTLGADTDNDILEAYNPRWRLNGSVDWQLNDVSISYNMAYFSKTRRFTTEQLAANPDISDPKYFFYKERWEHDLRLSVDVGDRFTLYGGVNNIFDSKPSFDQLSYPVSGIGRFLYAGAKVKLGKLF